MRLSINGLAVRRLSTVNCCSHEVHFYTNMSSLSSVLLRLVQNSAS
jgi:hypothetical protein